MALVRQACKSKDRGDGRHAAGDAGLMASTRTIPRLHACWALTCSPRQRLDSVVGSFTDVCLQPLHFEA